MMKRITTALLLLLACCASSRSQAVRVNCGGSAYTDSAGNVWAADYGSVGGLAYGPTAAAVSGTPDPTLYRTERYGTKVVYTLAVVPGRYRVTVRLAEIYFTSARSRVMNVLINGAAAFTNIDIYALAGANRALDEVVDVDVTGPVLVVELDAVVNNAKCSAISAVPVVPSDVTAPVVVLTSPAPGPLSGVSNLVVSATDDSGTVSSVQPLVDGAPFGPALLAAPYRALLDPASLTVGSHVLSATAKDPAGNVGRAPDVAVVVSGQLFDVTLAYDDGTPLAAVGQVLFSENVGTADVPLWRTDVAAPVSTAGRILFRYLAQQGVVYVVQVQAADGVTVLWQTGTQLTPGLLAVAGVQPNFTGLVAALRFSRSTGAWLGFTRFEVSY